MWWDNFLTAESAETERKTEAENVLKCLLVGAFIDLILYMFEIT